MTPASEVLSRARALRQLEQQGGGFEFVQAVRLMARIHPDREMIGGWAIPGEETVRLSVPPTLAFPPAEIASFSAPTAPDRPARMAVRFLGLTGPQGVLPHLYTEHAAGRARVRDTAFRDFLDLFHHRALSLFYRAWERHRPTVAAERGDDDRLRGHLLDLAGIGTAAVQKASAVEPTRLAHYAGLLSLRTRPAVALAQLVSDYFDVPATIEQFVGEWRTLEHGGQLALGDEGLDGTLGSAVVGNAVYDPQARVRLRLGPLTRAQFDAFLPGGASHIRLAELARLFADDQVGVEAQLVLHRDETPRAALGDPGAPALGFGSWLRTKPPVVDPDDVRLTLC